MDHESNKKQYMCIAIAATMYCVEEETKIKIYHTLSVCEIAMQQLDNL